MLLDAVFSKIRVNFNFSIVINFPIFFFSNHLISVPHPFPESSRKIISEAVDRITFEIQETSPPHNTNEEETRLIARELSRHKRYLESKLQLLCSNSSWHGHGRPDLLPNRSGIQLKRDQLSALRLGLKYATNRQNNQMIDWHFLNYKREANDFDQGFILCMVFGLT